METTLFKINQEIESILHQIDEMDGEVTEEIANQLSIKESELASKAMSYLGVIKSQESFISQIDDEIKRLTQLKKHRNNLIDRLKSNLLTAVELFGDFEVGTHQFKTRKSTILEVDDVNLLPNEYKTTKVVESANKAEIKKVMKYGEEVVGCRLIEKNNLVIK